MIGFHSVVKALTASEKKYVPYRESTFTRLLQDSFGGSAKTTFIAMVSPSEREYDETLATLRCALKVNMIVNSPEVNESFGDGGGDGGDPEDF